MKTMTRWLLGQRGDMVEGAMTLPLMTLVTLALVNLAMAGYAAVTANNAVNYAARVASVSQQTAIDRGHDRGQSRPASRHRHL